MLCFGEKPNTFHCKLVLLDETELVQDVQKAARGQELLEVVYKHLNLIETAYFGLRYVDKNSQTHWLEPTKKITKQLRGSTTAYTLYFGVKFYASDPCKLVEEITRYQFFLQIKQDILLGRLPVDTEMMAQLFAYAVQSELGDYEPQRHQPSYVSEFRFVANQTSDLENKIAEIHQSLMGQVPAVSEHHFLEKVKWLDMYGVDLHPVLGEDNIEYFLGLTPSGVIVLRNQTKVGYYYWPRITKVYFKGKYFMLRVRDKANDENTYGFELPTKQACKHLWKCCVEHHTFFRLIQVKDFPQHKPSLFNLGSRSSHVSQTEKMAQDKVQLTPRVQPAFTRKPSKRYQHRSGPPDGADAPVPAVLSFRDENKNNLVSANNHESNVERGTSESVTASTARMNPPWIDSSASQRGLYTSKVPDSPRSIRSAGDKPSQRFPLHRRSSVESEVSCDSRKHRHHHHHHHRSCRSSDNDSEISKSSRHSKSSRSGHRRKHRSRNSKHRDSGSDSDYHQKHKHRRHRSDNSVHELVQSEGQWKEIQLQRGNCGAQNAVIKTLSNRKSGYMNSGMESESEVCHRARKKHRRRSRSRSPENRNRPPDEIRKYIEYQLIEPKGEDDLRDIKYTKVETDGRAFRIKYSPKGNRHRHKSPKHSRHSLNETECNGHPDNYLEDTPPPPYSQSNNRFDCSPSTTNGLYVPPSGVSTAQVSMATTSRLLNKEASILQPSNNPIQMYSEADHNYSDMTSNQKENSPYLVNSAASSHGQHNVDYRSLYAANHYSSNANKHSVENGFRQNNEMRTEL